jgi:Na+-transporting methylmalonyl-CoA/oxaloacetate decarboxylase gamma subunit
MWNVDWSVVAYGAQLTVVGMGLVFLALGLVVLSMVILTRLPWLQAKEEGVESSEEPSPVVEADERARVAAIAVALALSEERPRPKFTPTERRLSAWKMQGRILQIQR